MQLLLNTDRLIDSLTHLIVSKGNENVVSTKEKPEIVSSPQDENAQTETCQHVYSDSITILTHLFIAKSVEKPSDTKKDHNTHEEAVTKENIISDQNQNRDEVKALLITLLIKEDECVPKVSQTYTLKSKSEKKLSLQCSM